ncbi:MAG TPA: hypothetical protein VMR23_00015 [Candidatus Limnocylindria bacterium]|nr:hypothetical protein [Candidatus Limnocylindria bacterium]
MDIVSRLTSYARAVPAGLKAAGQELAKTAAAGTPAPAESARRNPKKAAPRAAPAKGTRAKPKAKTKGAAAKPKGRKATR